MINDFKDAFPELNVPANKYFVMKKLKAVLPENLYVASSRNRDPIICRSTIFDSIVIEHHSAKGNEKKTRLQIIKDAAKVISEEILSVECERNFYPPAPDFFENLDKNIPESLITLLVNIIFYGKGVKKNEEAYRFNKKVLAISHAIVSATKPKHYKSTLLIGLAANLYHLFGSRNLIEMLSCLGFYASYHEISIFQASIIKAINDDKGPSYSNCFSQFSFDNADHNVATLNGMNTFHYMGGIRCVVPHSSVQHQEIKRLSKLPKSNTFLLKGVVPLQQFIKDPQKEMRNTLMKDLENFDLRGIKFVDRISVSDGDFLWLYNKYENNESVSGWNHFMETLTRNLNFKRTRIIALPFICGIPSDYNTIYTSLTQACEEAEKTNQKFVYVTFDQPLYMKARDILNSSVDKRLENVILILGNFHLIMSYLGSIGYIMEDFV